MHGRRAAGLGHGVRAGAACPLPAQDSAASGRAHGQRQRFLQRHPAEAQAQWKRFTGLVAARCTKERAASGLPAYVLREASAYREYMLNLRFPYRTQWDALVVWLQTEEGRSELTTAQVRGKPLLSAATRACLEAREKKLREEKANGGSVGAVRKRNIRQRSRRPDDEEEEEAAESSSSPQAVPWQRQRQPRPRRDLPRIDYDESKAADDDGDDDDDDRAAAADSAQDSAEEKEKEEKVDGDYTPDGGSVDGHEEDSDGRGRGDRNSRSSSSQQPAAAGRGRAERKVGKEEKKEGSDGVQATEATSRRRQAGRPWLDRSSSSTGQPVGSAGRSGQQVRARSPSAAAEREDEKRVKLSKAVMAAAGEGGQRPLQTVQGRLRAGEVRGQQSMEDEAQGGDGSGLRAPVQVVGESYIDYFLRLGGPVAGTARQQRRSTGNQENEAGGVSGGCSRSEKRSRQQVQGCSGGSRPGRGDVLRDASNSTAGEDEAAFEQVVRDVLLISATEHRQHEEAKREARCLAREKARERKEQ